MLIVIQMATAEKITESSYIKSKNNGIKIVH
jgi:hypothetical protein